MEKLKNTTDEGSRSESILGKLFTYAQLNVTFQLTRTPWSGSYSRSSRDTTVLLPHPLGPTRARVWPD